MDARPRRCPWTRCDNRTGHSRAAPDRRGWTGERRRSSRLGLVALAVLAPILLVACRAPVLRYKRQLVVEFRGPFGTDQQTHNRVRAACSGLPGVTTVPPTGLLPNTNVVFGIEKANDAQLAALYVCLSHQPSVASTEVDGGSSGGA